MPCGIRSPSRMLAVAALAVTLLAGQVLAVSPAEASAQPASRQAAAANYALGQVGKSYRWGGTGPDSYDCSGLVYRSYRQAGVHIPRSSRAQYSSLRKVSRSQLRRGDILAFSFGRGVSHVGMYLGNGRMVDVSSSRRRVVERPVMWNNFVGASRPS